MAGFSIVLLVFLFFYLLILGVAVLSYVFQSLGMYTIAKRRGIHHPWLAWLPVGSGWLLGSISDQYHYVVKREEKSRRKIMMGLYIAYLVLYFAVVACWIWGFGNIFGEVVVADNTALLEEMMVPVMIMYACLMLAVAAGIVLTVFQYMSLYDLYRSCDPENGTLFLVLSIVFNVAQPFLVFSCRKKDLGMPPRRPQPTEYQMPVIEPPVQPNVEE
jgi:hypothetical protein